MALIRMFFVLFLFLSVGVVRAAEKRASGVIMIDDLDAWNIEWFCGGPESAGFVQGPREQCNTGGALAFDDDDNVYIACGTYVIMIPAKGPVSIIAGTPGMKGHVDGPAWKASFSGARDIVIHDRILYFLDSANYTVRSLVCKEGRWYSDTVAGVSGKSGHRDGVANQALFMAPFDGLSVDENGVLYVLDGNWLRKIENNVVTTLNAGTGRKDGPLNEAGFNRAMGGGHSMDYDGAGSLYIADRWNHAVRKVDLRKKEVSTVAGVFPGQKKGPPKDGPVADAKFHPGGGPYQIYYNRTYKFILLKVADEYCRIRWIKDGQVRTFGSFAGKKEKKPVIGALGVIAGGSVYGFDRNGNVYLGGLGGIQIAKKAEGAQ